MRRRNTEEDRRLARVAQRGRGAKDPHRRAHAAQPPQPRRAGLHAGPSSAPRPTSEAGGRVSKAGPRLAMPPPLHNPLVGTVPEAVWKECTASSRTLFQRAGKQAGRRDGQQHEQTGAASERESGGALSFPAPSTASSSEAAPPPAAPSAAPPAAPPPPRRRPVAVRIETEVVGNRDKWSQVLAWFRGGWKESPLLVVEGPCGVGKTFNTELLALHTSFEPHCLSATERRTPDVVASAFVETKRGRAIGSGRRIFLFLDDAQLCEDDTIARLARLLQSSPRSDTPPILCTCESYWEKSLRPLHAVLPPETTIKMLPVTVSAMLGSLSLGSAWSDAGRQVLPGEFPIAVPSSSAAAAAAVDGSEEAGSALRAVRTRWVRFGLKDRPPEGKEIRLDAEQKSAFLEQVDGRPAAEVDGFPFRVAEGRSFLRAGGSTFVCVGPLAYACCSPSAATLTATAPMVATPGLLTRLGVPQTMITRSHVIDVAGLVCFRPVTGDAAPTARARSLAREVGGDLRQFVIGMTERASRPKNGRPFGTFEKVRFLTSKSKQQHHETRAATLEADESLLCVALFENYVDLLHAGASAFPAAASVSCAPVSEMDCVAEAADTFSAAALSSRFGALSPAFQYVVANMIQSQDTSGQLRFPAQLRLQKLFPGARSLCERKAALGSHRESATAVADIPACLSERLSEPKATEAGKKRPRRKEK